MNLRWVQRCCAVAVLHATTKQRGAKRVSGWGSKRDTGWPERHWSAHVALRPPLLEAAKQQLR